MDSYFTNRELTRPYTSGLNKSDMTLDEIRALTPALTYEEAQAPFAEYYYEDPVKLAPEMLEAAKSPLSSDQCYMPMESGRIMLTHDSRYPVNGFGVLENGVGYASMVIRQYGITDEMIRYYRENFAVNEECRNLFYKLWCPRYHIIHFNDAIVEDFGWGFQLQDMNWELFNMEHHFGIRREEISELDPRCIAIMAPGGTCMDIMHPEQKEETCMIQYLTENEKGRELWIHYWVGIALKPDGSYEICPRADHDTMESHMRHMMLHAMTECSNEVRHIKAFWEGRPQRRDD